MKEQIKNKVEKAIDILLDALYDFSYSEFNENDKEFLYKHLDESRDRLLDFINDIDEFEEEQEE